MRKQIKLLAREPGINVEMLEDLDVLEADHGE